MKIIRLSESSLNLKTIQGLRLSQEREILCWRIVILHTCWRRKLWTTHHAWPAVANSSTNHQMIWMSRCSYPQSWSRVINAVPQLPTASTTCRWCPWINREVWMRLPQTFLRQPLKARLVPQDSCPLTLQTQPHKTNILRRSSQIRGFSNINRHCHRCLSQVAVHIFTTINKLVIMRIIKVHFASEHCSSSSSHNCLTGCSKDLTKG